MSKLKYVYNNYQFYEMGALNEYINKQSAKGYELCGGIGYFFNILKFRQVEDKIQKTYSIFRKHLDKEIDRGIEKKSKTYKVVYENDIYTVLESNQYNEKLSGKTLEKQNEMLGLPIKESVIHIVLMLLLCFVNLGLETYFVLSTLNKVFNFCSMGVYLTILLSFLFYFFGDVHDVFAGKANIINSKIYFNERTKFKKKMFVIADVLKFAALILSVCLSAIFLFYSKNEIIRLNVMAMLIVSAVVGFASWFKNMGRYVFLLDICVFLAILLPLRIL